MSIEIDQEEYIVKFLKKKNLELGIFVWHEPEDISLIAADDIVSFLPEPTPTLRGELVFNIDCLKNDF